MNTLLLTKEQVDLLDYKQSKAALKLLFKTYDMEKPVMKMTKAEYDIVDDIGNTMLWLEDRIRQFEDPRIPSMDPGVPVVKPNKPAVVPKTKIRKFRIGDKIYDTIHHAVRATGVKLNTLRTYVGRNPDKYGYVEN